MPGYNHVFQRILIRQAIANSASPHAVADQITWLTALQSGIFAMAKNGESTLTSSSLNGKSFTLQIEPGRTKSDVMESIELAIETLEAGNAGPITTIYGRSP